MQQELVASYPTRFFKPQTSASGSFAAWLGVFLNGADVDWDEVEMIIGEAYRAVAKSRR